MLKFKRCSLGQITDDNVSGTTKGVISATIVSKTTLAFNVTVSIM